MAQLRDQPYFESEVEAAKCGDDLCGIFSFSNPAPGLSWVLRRLAFEQPEALVNPKGAGRGARTTPISRRNANPTTLQRFSHPPIRPVARPAADAAPTALPQGSEGGIHTISRCQLQLVRRHDTDTDTDTATAARYAVWSSCWQKLQLLRRIAGRLSQPQQSDDLLQDALEKALKDFGRFQAGTNFTAWIRTIMQRLVIDNWRRRGRYRTVELQSHDLLTSEPRTSRCGRSSTSRTCARRCPGCGTHPHHVPGCTWRDGLTRRWSPCRTSPWPRSAPGCDGAACR